MILFTELGAVARNAEHWAEDPGQPQTLEAIPLSVGSARVQALSPSAYRLSGIWSALKRSGDYRPIRHLAWQQPGYDSSDVRAVHLEKTVETEDLNKDLPEELADIQIIDESYQPPEMIFDGNIRLRTTRYLHMEVDMAFFPQNLQQILAIQKQRSVNADNLKINPESDYIRLVESRRIKLNELHYFDHPLFGILVQVSRLITP